MHNSNHLIHRSYFEEYSNTGDPYTKFLLSWRIQMPEYKIMKWNSGTFDISQYEWTRIAHREKQPVFISELVRWKALSEFGGLYLDADCEITNGKMLDSLIRECDSSSEYDAFVGVEDLQRGAPTAQTVYSKPGSNVANFMLDLYANRLAPLWIWRESKLLIGPDLLTLYFYENGNKVDFGYFPKLLDPIVVGRVKIYPQDYFSPKFGISGNDLFLTANTCVYHAFANGNISFESDDLRSMQKNPMLLNEYLQFSKLRPSGSPKSLIRSESRKIFRILRNLPKVVRHLKSMYRSL